MYLDIDYWQLNGNEDKQELMMAKRVEVNCVFNRYLGEVPSLKHYRSAPSFEAYQPEPHIQTHRQSKENYAKYNYDSP